MKTISMLAVIALALCTGAAARPYELTDAGRAEDAHPAIVDFEKPCEWKVRCWDAEATVADGWYSVKPFLGAFSYCVKH